MKIEPRVIRLTDAPAYLGMGAKYFNEHVRPNVELVNLGGNHMKMFDRLDLDAWFTNHKAANGKPTKEQQSWQKEHQASEKREKFGTLRKSSQENSFELALAKRSLSKQNGS